jgi:D-alanyl-D-alanine carboxypeptidase/D-alanyl-D-alanine-endopeptidase (penicillin-binding protein 4)
MKKCYNEATFSKDSFTFYILIPITVGIIFLISFASCSVSRQINKVAKQNIINKPDFTSAHIGICIYDPSKNKWLYNYNSDKYFIPASNIKIMTCYSAMKYLGDSLTGLRYVEQGDTIKIIPNGDPTLLHPDFAQQPVLSFLSHFDSTKIILINDNNFRDNSWGNGWAWNDYTEDYMVERSSMPIYGNVVSFEGTANTWSSFPSIKGQTIEDSVTKSNSYLTKIKRDISANTYKLYFNGASEKKINVPFYTDSGEINAQLLQTIINAKIIRDTNSTPINFQKEYQIIHSQLTDSLLKIMMHRSDNFFAEQSLLMVSNEMLGVMNDEKIIDTLLKTDFKDMPQKPRWVDGSGLSRYNLFTPQDFVFVLNKLRSEFSWSRIATIFPTGGSGTLGNTYKNLQGKIYAKTGTLSNNAALSGYIITNKGKTLTFSILVGNHMASATTIREAIAEFLESVQEEN